MNAYCNIVVNLTNKCNTFCRYCFRSSSVKGKEFLSTEIVKKVLNWCKDRADGKQFLQLTGGEIFIHPGVWDIIDYAKNIGFIIRLQTNGLLFLKMSNEQLALLAQPGIITKISLDGWNSETHETYRAKRTFKRVMSGLERFAVKKPRFCIKCVLSRQVADNFQKMLDLSLQLGTAGISYNFLRSEGCASKFVNEVDEVEFAKKAVTLFNLPMYRRLLNGSQILEYWIYPQTFQKEKHFFVNYDGNVFSNQKLLPDELIGNVNEDISCLTEDRLVSDSVVRSPEIWNYIRENLRIKSVNPA